jgi:hypothetical protein
MDVHLVDGTYELFRHYYALPSARDQDGHGVAAVRGVLRSVLGMIRGGATHIAVATDHVIESFRNGLWAGYKTGDGIEPDLLAQFDPWTSKQMTYSLQRQPLPWRGQSRSPSMRVVGPPEARPASIAIQSVETSVDAWQFG